MVGTNWTEEENQLLRSFLHHTYLGGLNTGEKLTYKEIAEKMNAQGVGERRFSYDTVARQYHRGLKPMYENDPAYETMRNEHRAWITLETEKEIQLIRSLLHYTLLGGLNLGEKLTYEKIADSLNAAYKGEKHYTAGSLHQRYTHKLLPKFEQDPAYETLRDELVAQMGSTVPKPKPKILLSADEAAAKRLDASQRAAKKATTAEQKAEFAEEAAEALSKKLADEEAKSPMKLREMIRLQKLREELATSREAAGRAREEATKASQKAVTLEKEVDEAGK